MQQIFDSVKINRQLIFQHLVQAASLQQDVSSGMYKDLLEVATGCQHL